MDESGSRQRRGPASRDDGETIQFGGLPVRWPGREIRLPRMPHLASIAIALAVGLPIAFFGGRLTAHPAGHAARSFQPVSTPIVVPELATSVIGLTGDRCAVQVGDNLQIGVEITNEAQRPITLSAIRPMFPLGGLRAISSGVRTCGELRQTSVVPAGPLAPGAVEWIETTVAVRQACPGALPVWFRVSYTSAGKPGTTMLAGFPDLGSVPYRQCKVLSSARSGRAGG